MDNRVRPVLKYPGSKWRIAQWIIGMMKEHHSYVEPFFGSGAVFFNKRQSNIETINDIDERITSLFRIIRDEPDALAKLLYDTPYSREEYELAFVEAEDELESARRFLVQCWQGHGFRVNESQVGWKTDVVGREKAYSLSNWNRLPDWVQAAQGRLKMAQIENRPALDVVKRFNYSNVLLYLDPPYLLETRTSKQYKYEYTEEDHIALLKTLVKHKGSIIISGYDSDIYNQYLKGWNKLSMKSNAEYYNGGSRDEVIWMNYETMPQLSVFDVELL